MVATTWAVAGLTLTLAAATAQAGDVFTCSPEVVGVDYVLNEDGCNCDAGNNCDTLQLAYVFLD